MDQRNYDKLQAKLAKYFTAYDLPFTIRLMRENYSAACEQIFYMANLLRDNIFVFQDNWDMEPCATPFLLNPLTWNHSPNGDPEWVFMLNRQEYLSKLLWAWYLSGDISYINKLKFFLFDWIEQNPIKAAGGLALRTLDTGIRCTTWLTLLLHLIHGRLLQQTEALTLINSIEAQLTYLRQAYIGKYSLSNWGVLQTTAIWRNFLWFGDFFSDSSLEGWARQELAQQLDLQILADGAHWEQSILYHGEVYNSCINLALQLQSLKQPVPQFLQNKIALMAKYLLYAATPDHQCICQGDSDVNDLRDTMVKAAILLQAGQFKFAGYPEIDFATLGQLGKPGYEHYNGLMATEPVVKNYSGSDSGTVYLRSSFAIDASYTFLTNGPLGSGHGHADLTHISLYWRGKSFLTDCGRYTYREDEPLRALLKTAKSHNVGVIDNDPAGRPIRSWEYDAYGDCLKNYVCTQAEITYVEMPYTAKLQTGTPYFCKRRVVVIDPDIWLSVQEVQCAGVHSYAAYYNLDAAVTVQGEGTAWTLLNGNSKLALTSDKPWVSEAGVMAKQYNSLSKTIRLVKKVKTFTDQLIEYDFFTGGSVVIKPAIIYQFGNAEAAPKDLVMAWELVINAALSYIVVIFNRETWRGGKVFYYQDIPLYGKCIVLKRTADRISRVRLRV